MASRPKITVNVFHNPTGVTVAYKFKYMDKWYGAAYEPGYTPLEQAVEIMLQKALDHIKMLEASTSS